MFGNLKNPFAQTRSSTCDTDALEETNFASYKKSLEENKQTKTQPSLSSSIVTPNLKPIKVIGNGAFGYVFEALDKNTNKRVALKRT